MSRRRAWVAVAVVVALVMAACGSGGSSDENEGAAVASDVADWPTWVVGAPGSIDVPPPPAGLPSSTSGSTAPLGGEWIEKAMEFVSARTKDPPASSRAYALVAVAAFDALVVARHWQATFDSPGYPSESAAVAGAASRVLAHLFPEQPALRLDQQAEDDRGPGRGGHHRPRPRPAGGRPGDRLRRR